jgi:hypothetical protein
MARPAALEDIDHWLEAYRRLWEERFDRLDDYLRGLQQQQQQQQQADERSDDSRQL